MLTRAQIEVRIPPAGSMVLLERLVRYDETRIVCEAAPPTPEHPLARAEGVPAVAAVEYAAQAAALHGALLDSNCEPRHGMLAKLSDVELIGGWLGVPSTPLTVQADLLVRGVSGCMYSFTVHDEQGRGARGRLLVAFTNDH
jgi:predicted hotdog family 3-hydroxylacyl-ACP dehydratase